MTTENKNNDIVVVTLNAHAAAHLCAVRARTPARTAPQRARICSAPGTALAPALRTAGAHRLLSPIRPYLAPNDTGRLPPSMLDLPVAH